MRTHTAQLLPWPRRHGIIFHPPFHQRISCYHLCYLLSGDACAVLYLIVYLYIAPYIDCSFYTQLRFFRLHFETETKTGSRRCMNYGNRQGCKLIRLPLLQFEPQCVVLDILQTCTSDHNSKHIGMILTTAAASGSSSYGTGNDMLLPGGQTNRKGNALRDDFPPLVISFRGTGTC